MIALHQKSYKDFSVKRVAILGVFLALLIALKWALGFIPGIEVVSFLFIVFALFLPFFDLMLLIICFNLLILAMYGFGGWWFAYWVIWPIDALGAKLISKLTKNRFAIASWGFLAGMSVGFWYYFSDLLFFGKTYAMANIFTAIPINLIEGLTTLFMIVMVAPKLLRIVSIHAVTFWNKEQTYTFKPVIHRKLNIAITSLIVLGAITGIVLLFVYNDFFINLKEGFFRNNASSGPIVNQEGVPSGWFALSPQEYSDVYSHLGDHQVGVVILENGKYHYEVVSFTDGQTVYDAMNHMKLYEFSYHNSGGSLGQFVQTFRERGTQAWLHGTNSSQNYGDYYPMYLLNHQYAGLGVSNMHIQTKDIIEITYDHNA